MALMESASATGRESDKYTVAWPATIRIMDPRLSLEALIHPLESEKE
jgi:hypothetical protein